MYLRGRLGFAAVVGAVFLSSSISVAGGQRAAGQRAAGLRAAGLRAAPLSAQVSFTGRDRAIPPSFLGISIEYNELARFEAGQTSFDRAISLIRPRGGAPMLLRIGGRSADDAYWQTPTGTASRSVFELGDRWLGGLVTLAQRDDLHVMLDLNLAVHSPQMAAAFAHAVSRALSPTRLAGISVGNEPSNYGHQLRLQRERTATTLPSTRRHWAVGYTPADYWRDFRGYSHALAAAVPGVPLAAPEVPSYTNGWLTGAHRLGNAGPRVIAIHRYPLSTCLKGSRYPSIRSLLSERAAAVPSHLGGNALRYSRAHHLAIRLTEVNSISCGGKQGVADSFATALWSPDALFEMIDAGIDGVNWHIRSNLRNAPFQLGKVGLEPRPELYGLALFAQMLGPGARLLGVKLVSSPGAHLKAWAVSSASGPQVLLINKGSRSIKADVLVSTPTGQGRVERLRAPSLRSRSRVTLAGRSIGNDGRWHGRTVTIAVHEKAGAYGVVVPAYSAAVLDISR